MNDQQTYSTIVERIYRIPTLNIRPSVPLSFNFDAVPLTRVSLSSVGISEIGMSSYLEPVVGICISW